VLISAGGCWLVADWLFRRDLILFCFLTPTHARSIRHQYRRASHYLLLSVLSLAPVAVAGPWGIILVVAMLVTPGATAHCSPIALTAWFGFAWAGDALGASWASTGVLDMDASTAGCIVLTQTGLFRAQFSVCTPPWRAGPAAPLNGFTVEVGFGLYQGAQTTCLQVVILIAPLQR